MISQEKFESKREGILEGLREIKEEIVHTIERIDDIKSQKEVEKLLIWINQKRQSILGSPHGEYRVKSEGEP